jgi:choice-of-anchor C domain-containing protein
MGASQPIAQSLKLYLQIKARMRKFFLAAVLFSPLLASATNLIQNGDFESYSPTFSGYSVVNAGSSELTGWTVGGTSVDVIKGSYGAIQGNSIDLLGSPGPGSLSQTFATVSGQNYLLTFDLSANGSGGDSKALTVNFGGAVGNFFGSNAAVASKTLSFTANSAESTLSFASALNGISGAVIDNVAVSAVPEPESYAMLLAGLGLIGAAVKRRKAKQA